uniref:PIR2-like helical domain-containing protein n=1 Tax=Oryza glumipatula TaxID=40148 RepID=A0A0E0BEE6_9ORYZ
MKTKLSKCISVHANATQHIPTDASPPCAHILSLYMCLLDAIHAFFIRALAALPLPLPLPAADSTLRRGRLLRALVVSGHCYGPLDPVSNIILNAIWYAAAYPLPPLPRHQGDGDDEIDDELPQDISDTHAMARMASRSLNGLITLLRAITTTTTGAPLSKHEAVEYLWSTQCDLTDKLQQQHTVTMTKKKNTYAAAAEASKHPQHTALGSFLLSLSGDGEKLDWLRHLLRSITDGSGRTKVQA